MDSWHIASGAACIVAGFILAIIVLHPKIHEGLVAKAGLITMILSLAATAALTYTESTDWAAYWRAGFTLRAGLAVACLGIILKAHRMGRAIRQHRPVDVQRQMTNRWIHQITEPARDMAYLFRDERETKVGLKHEVR
jgi:hypothetical protein